MIFHAPACTLAQNVYHMPRACPIPMHAGQAEQGKQLWGNHVCSGYLEDAVKGSCSVVGSFWGRSRGVRVAHALYPWALQGSSEAPGHRDGPSCWPQGCVVVPNPFQRGLEAAATPASARRTTLALTSGEIRTSHVSSYCIACRNMTALRCHILCEFVQLYLTGQHPQIPRWRTPLEIACLCLP